MEIEINDGIYNKHQKPRQFTKVSFSTLSRPEIQPGTSKIKTGFQST